MDLWNSTMECYTSYWIENLSIHLYRIGLRLTTIREIFKIALQKILQMAPFLSQLSNPIFLVKYKNM